MGSRQIYFLLVPLVFFTLVSSFWIFAHLNSPLLPYAHSPSPESIRKVALPTEVHLAPHQAQRVETEKIQEVHREPTKQGSQRVEAELINFDVEGVFTNLPAIVQAWRNAAVDWHELIPNHNSKWERFGDVKEAYNFRSLVEKEIMITDFLTRYHESGLSQRYGKDHGRLFEYSQCNTVEDPCMVHSVDSCSRDDFCVWDKQSQVCRIWTWAAPSSQQKLRPEHCDFPSRIEKGDVKYVADVSQCSTYVTDKTLLLTLGKEPQTMFFQFWSFFQEMFHWWRNDLKSVRSMHLIIVDLVDASMLGFLGTISKFCWRRLQQVPEGTCFCDASKKKVVAQHTDKMFPAARYVSSFMLERSREQQQIARNQTVFPEKATQKITVGLISRRLKRFILNEYELCMEAAKDGFVCKLLPFETMTIHEQMRELSTLDILVGVHGSGLENAIFLRPKDAVLVQLYPCLPNVINSYRNISVGGTLGYLEWKHDNSPNLTVTHWDTLGNVNPQKQKELLQFGSNPNKTVAVAGMEKYFWIN
eukprot:CAMPEP_0169304528 /NCGR_PEP_ID=MMETSP1016-20121227/69929_1 /TAXON_ID=342587 /ORGANISM="Karlodinium micrum, Strain CCMP2283" /LENGTH=529 /DNA_ID=CAMNT_0009397407 /DNA_START=69 /DNA_END=1655 /DNA_ORIENTATION=-